MNERRREIGELWRRAGDSLAAAQKLLADGFADFAASRAYYAAFYAASAVLLSEGKSFSKHTALLGHIHKDYVKPDRLPAEIGRIISSLYDLRNVADYGGPAHVDTLEAEKAIADAGLFLRAVRPLLPADL